MSTVIFTYTNDQAIDDGIKMQIGPNLYATTNLFSQVQPDEDIVMFVLKVRALLEDYNAGVYFHDGATDYPEESDRFFASYLLDGLKVWAILDADGLHLLLPEDY
jgi:hypothetical protein